MKTSGILSRVSALGGALVVALAMFGGPAGAADRSITVAAAASLTEVVDALGAAFEELHGTGVTASYSASSAAARQVINGAPFDVLISANADWIDAAADAGAIDPQTERTIARNSLVIVANTSAQIASGVSADEVLGLAESNAWRIAIADPDHVPAGLYAAEALRNMAWWDRLKGLLVPLQNVRAALAFVERGDTPIGFAYATDLRISTASREVARFDPATYSPIRYRAAVVTQAPAPEAAAAFLDFVISPAGQAIIEDHGFRSPFRPAASADSRADDG